MNTRTKIFHEGLTLLRRSHFDDLKEALGRRVVNLADAERVVSVATMEIENVKDVDALLAGLDGALNNASEVTECHALLSAAGYGEGSLVGRLKVVLGEIAIKRTSEEYPEVVRVPREIALALHDWAASPTFVYFPEAVRAWLFNWLASERKSNG